MPFAPLQLQLSGLQALQCRPGLILEIILEREFSLNLKGINILEGDSQ